MLLVAVPGDVVSGDGDRAEGGLILAFVFYVKHSLVKIITRKK